MFLNADQQSGVSKLASSITEKALKTNLSASTLLMTILASDISNMHRSISAPASGRSDESSRMITRSDEASGFIGVSATVRESRAAFRKLARQSAKPSATVNSTSEPCLPTLKSIFVSVAARAFNPWGTKACAGVPYMIVLVCLSSKSRQMVGTVCR